MIRKLLICLSVVASPALSEPFSQSGYALGCDDTGCEIFSAGFVMHVANDGSTPAWIIRTLAKLNPVTAVNLKGDLGELGDVTAPLTLTGLSVKTDDRYQETLRALQSKWRPKGADKDSPMFTVISGLEWTNMTGSDDGASFMISPGSACADGKPLDGITLSLYPLGGDPSEAACYQVISFSETELDLVDVKAGTEHKIYERVTN